MRGACQPAWPDFQVKKGPRRRGRVPQAELVGKRVDSGTGCFLRIHGHGLTRQSDAQPAQELGCQVVPCQHQADRAHTIAVKSQNDPRPHQPMRPQSCCNRVIAWPRQGPLATSRPADAAPCCRQPPPPFAHGDRTRSQGNDHRAESAQGGRPDGHQRQPPKHRSGAPHLPRRLVVKGDGGRGFHR